VSVVDYSLVGALLLLLGGLLLLNWRVNGLVAARRTLTRGLSGSQRMTMEDLIASQGARIAQLEASLAQVTATQTLLAARLDATEQAGRKALQRVGFVRYNPFGDTGGDQSFAIALTDATGSGVLLNSIYSRANIRFYAKPLKQGASSYTLSTEEAEAIKLAAA